MPALLFADLARASTQIASTRSRLEKKQLLTELLREAPPAEVAAAVGWLVAEPLCGPLGVGPAQLWQLSRTSAPVSPSLTLGDVEHALEQASLGGREAVLPRVAAVFEKLTEPERAFFIGAFTGSLRQGSLGGIMLLALADLFGRDEGDVRRLTMVQGSIPRAAQALLEGGGAAAKAEAAARIELFRPLSPMLAAPASSLEEALHGIADPWVEWKVDGVRAQVHKQGRRVAVYSRQGHDITAGCAPVGDALAALLVDSVVLDGEIVLVGADGKPRPFQDSFSAVASKGPPRETDRLRLYLFDCLHKNGVDLLDEPLLARLEALHTAAPAELCMPSVRAGDLDEVRGFYARALASGHEGVLVKDLTAPYRLGARGRAWQKVKEFTTVDLVILAAEWGSGRRKGFLSNLHLGALRKGGTFCMVGKTFKGLTDEMLRWQTSRLQELATERTGHVVFVRPELVVEVRFNDVQRSPRYPGGIALRFARVVRYREDKPASDIEPLDALIARLPTEPGEPLRRRTQGQKQGSAKKKRKKTTKTQLSLFEKGS